jgi:hypothetical protein
MTDSTNTPMNSPISGDSTVFPVCISKTFVVEVLNQEDLDYMQDINGFAKDFATDLAESEYALIEIDGVKVSA